MNYSFRFNKSFKDTRRWLASLLTFALLMASFSGIANAAEDTVTGIQFTYDSSDYNSSTSALTTFVEEDKVDLSVFTITSGSSSKNVTTEATWKSSNTAIVKVEGGTLTGVGKGTSTISATYKGYTISIKATSDYVYDSVTLLQNNTTAPEKTDIEIGESLNFTLNGTKSNVSKDITNDAVWTSSNSSIATVDDGTLTILGVGTVTITAKYKGKSDAITINVTSPYKSIAIESSPSSSLLEFTIGSDDIKLTAKVAPKTGGTLEVTEAAKWVSANDKIATVSKGVVSPVSAGKTTITVSHKGVSATIDVVVRSAYQSIKLSPEKEYHLLLQDAPIQVTAEVLSNSNVTETVTSKATWTSSNVVVATVSEGKISPKAVGTTKITASYLGISRSIDITVYPSVVDISIETETIDGFIGISEALPVVMGTTFDGTKVDVSKLASWTSEDESIANIKDGNWTAKAIGESKLTATVQGKKATTELTVHVKPLKLIADVKDVSIILGKETSLPSVTVINEDGEEEDISSRIKWKTTSDNIVLKEKTMKGLEVSSLALTGTYLTKSVTVRIKIEEEIVKFVFDPTTVELNPGRSKSVKVTGYYKSGKQVSLGSKMNWESGNPNIATVNNTSVKAVAVGTTKITGSYQGNTIIVPIVVTQKLKSLVLSTKSIQLSKGGVYNAKLQANYTTGSPANITENAVWTSSKASVATVTAGKIVAVGKGSTSIKATYAGKSVTIRVTVK